MKNKRTSLLIALLMVFALSLCASLGLWINNVHVQGSAGDPTLIGWDDEADYGFTLGGFVEIPEVKITYGGETKTAEVIVTKPDGESVKSSKVQLTVGGIYTIEFRAVFGGKIKSVKKQFRVDTPLFTTGSTKTTWEYGEDDSDYNTGKTGLKVRMAKDDTLTYNEILDFITTHPNVNVLYTVDLGGIAVAHDTTTLELAAGGFDYEILNQNLQLPNIPSGFVNAVCEKPRYSLV